jgi:5-methylcytosine-specific restriction endonuclease McrA
MNEATKRLVRARAGDRCEYCLLLQADSPLARLQIEHILPRKHGGGDDAENLALACIDCNLHKGANLAGMDDESGQLTPLFNPRVDSWHEHFEWRGIHVFGKTALGRVTVHVLNMNSDDQLALRSI